LKSNLKGEETETIEEEESTTCLMIVSSVMIDDDDGAGGCAVVVIVDAAAAATLLATTLVINDDEPSLVLPISFIFIPKALCLFCSQICFPHSNDEMMLSSSSSQNLCVFFCFQIFFLTPMMR
jgi:hypothetical protein